MIGIINNHLITITLLVLLYFYINLLQSIMQSNLYLIEEKRAKNMTRLICKFLHLLKNIIILFTLLYIFLLIKNN